MEFNRTMNNEYGTPDTICSATCIADNCRHLKYIPVGKIKVSRGDMFYSSFDEHLLPEGTKTLYIERRHDEL